MRNCAYLAVNWQQPPSKQGVSALVLSLPPFCLAGQHGMALLPQSGLSVESRNSQAAPPGQRHGVPPAFSYARTLGLLHAMLPKSYRSALRARRCTQSGCLITLQPLSRTTWR
jgi:hypothetical protein